MSRAGDLSLIVHPLFQNHIVLQRDIEVPVWSRALPGAVVTIELDNIVVGTATADAVIDADTVVVSSPSVASPVYVRYLWLDAGESAATNQLYNRAGLPTAPFISYPYCRLDVINGTGSKWALVPGDTPWAIAANPPSSGQIFDRWIGASSELADLNAASTTVTDPSHGLYLLATYRYTNETAYLLTVNSGYGSGTSKTGSVLIIEANAPSPNKIFDHWSGMTKLVSSSHPGSARMAIATMGRRLC